MYIYGVFDKRRGYIVKDMRFTEQVHPLYNDLDRLSSLELIEAFSEDQTQAIHAVQLAAPALAYAVEKALPRLKGQGRLMYIGAGTSGRLGVLDATELTPTFSWPRERAVALLAGGRDAIWQSTEGSEDQALNGQNDLLTAQIGAEDVLIAIAASGTTPYVLAAIHTAKEEGALVIGIANNPETPLLAEAHCPVLLNTGPEVISGSTRLKAGTAQKIALNTLSSALMVQLGKVYGNLMVDVQASNQKLEERAVRLIQHATSVSEQQAKTALKNASGNVKTAIVMLKLGLNALEAHKRLCHVQGHARAALGE